MNGIFPNKIFIRSVSVDVTKKCNLSCGFCYLAGLKEKGISIYDNSEDFFSIDLFKKLVDEISLLQGVRINLTGGEPFLHPEIIEMIKYASEKGCHLSILTNGAVLDKKIILKMMSDFRAIPRVLMFSLDGLEEVNDKIRGKGCYKKIIEAISEIRRIKNIFGYPIPDLVVNTVINKLNVAELSNIVADAENLGVKRVNFFYVEWSNKELTEMVKEEFSARLDFKDEKSRIIEGLEHKFANLDVLEKKSLIKELERIEKLKPLVNVRIKFAPEFPLSNKDLIDRWFQNNQFRVKSCKSVFDHFRVDVDGSVCPICSFIYYPFGNLKNQTLEEILAGGKAKNFFEEIEKRKFFIVCQHCIRHNAI